MASGQKNSLVSGRTGVNDKVDWQNGAELSSETSKGNIDLGFM